MDKALPDSHRWNKNLKEKKSLQMANMLMSVVAIKQIGFWEGATTVESYKCLWTLDKLLNEVVWSAQIQSLVSVTGSAT